MRVLPDFIIIGAQRSGTTYLYDALLGPHVMGAVRKEVHFFDREFHRGPGRYRSAFPLRSTVRRRSASEAGAVVGEATPYYLAHPAVPARAASVVPGARLIVLLRDPVERAFSHYQHSRRLGFENLPFDEALRCEPQRLEGEEAMLMSRPRYRSAALERHSYATRGLYARQLRRWLEHYPREQLLVLSSEELFADANTVLRRVEHFLGVPARDVVPPRPPGSSQEVPPQVRARLRELFAPDGAELPALVGFSPPWF